MFNRSSIIEQEKGIYTLQHRNIYIHSFLNYCSIKMPLKFLQYVAKVHNHRGVKEITIPLPLAKLINLQAGEEVEVTIRRPELVISNENKNKPKRR